MKKNKTSEYQMIKKIMEVIPEAEPVRDSDDLDFGRIWFKGVYNEVDGQYIYYDNHVEQVLHPKLEALLKANGWDWEPYDMESVTAYCWQASNKTIYEEEKSLEDLIRGEL